jgi:hypothetical protein
MERVAFLLHPIFSASSAGFLNIDFKEILYLDLMAFITVISSSDE